MYYLIYFLICFPFFCSILILICPLDDKFIKQFGLASTLFCFFISVFFLLLFDFSVFSFQYYREISWFASTNFFLSIGVDGVSIYFILLTAFLIPICLLSSWNYKSIFLKTQKFLVVSFLIVESCIFIIFFTTDIMIFYTFFEAVLIPIFLIIGVFGSRERKTRAGYLLFIYTMAGSLLILFAIFVIFLETGSTSYINLLEHTFSFEKEVFLWLAFFISFAVKIPVIPFHLWLPEAHVEAPTAGSVFLAGILLKLGTYGVIRYNLAVFSLASTFFKPFLITLASLTVVYTSITAIRQTDIKRVIAYASVAHINVTLVGLFSFTVEGIEGALIQILSHGVISGALFLCVGVLYTRYHTRLISYYSGIALVMPSFALAFGVFTIGNIALPGTSSFVGEFLIFIGVFLCNKFVTVMVCCSMVLGACYSLWLFNRICYGNFKIQFYQPFDITKQEKWALYPLAFFMISIGLFPSFYFYGFHASVINLVMSLTFILWLIFLLMMLEFLWKNILMFFRLVRHWVSLCLVFVSMRNC